MLKGPQGRLLVFPPGNYGSNTLVRILNCRPGRLVFTGEFYTEWEFIYLFVCFSKALQTNDQQIVYSYQNI